MSIKTLQLGPMQNFTYIIIDDRTNTCALVDPGWEPQKILTEITKHCPQYVLLTHTHYDHCQAVPDLLLAYPSLPIYVHKNDWVNLPYKENLLHPDKPFTLGTTTITPIHTPGHQKGETCYLVDNNLFTGDFIFVDAIGRVDLPGSDPEAMYHSLFEVLYKLPDDTLILSGHDYGKTPTDTLANQKKTNPYLQCKTKKEFFALRGV